MKIKKIAIILSVITLLFVLTGCGEQGKIKKLFKQYETACRKGDAAGMIMCYTPEEGKPILVVIKALGIENTLMDIMKWADESALTESGKDLQSTLKTIKIKPVSYDFNTDKTYCEVKAECSIGKQDPKEVEFHCVLVDKIWYFTFK